MRVSTMGPLSRNLFGDRRRCYETEKSTPNSSSTKFGDKKICRGLYSANYTPYQINLSRM
jgi:hypothetical protein